MYGTMFRMKVKSGQVEKVRELFDEWEKDRQPKIKGVVGGPAAQAGQQAR